MTLSGVRSTSDGSPPAHHAPDGGFRNPWPESEPHGLRAVLRWARERRSRPRAPTPPRNSLPVATPSVVYPCAAEHERFATWIGHSTVLLQVAGLNVLTDPVWSERASPLQWIGPRRVMSPALAFHALPPLDVVLLSHSHYDHLDKATVRAIARQHVGVTWVVPLGVGEIIRGWGARTIVQLDWWQSACVHGLTVMATPARHFSARGLGDRNKTLWCGYAIEIAGSRAFFAGDSAYHPDFGRIGSECGAFDFVMMPIGAYDPRWFMRIVHMDPDEAVRAYQDILAADADAVAPLMLGIHWGTFRLTDEPLDEPPRRARARWTTEGLSEQRLWMARFGETRAW